MTTELHRAFTSLGKQGDDKQLPPYFLSYAVSDASFVGIRAQYGALVDSSVNRMRVADVQVRVGDPKLDNTHGTHRGSAVNSMQLPLTDDRERSGASLWLATNTGYGTALDNYLRVKTEAEVRAKEEDTSPDFSQERRRFIGKPAPAPVVDKAAWEERVRALSKIFREFPDVYQNIVMLTVQNETDYFASSEGSQLANPHHRMARLVVFAVSRADDGMDLFRAQTFEAETVDGLPKQAELEAACASWARAWKRCARRR
jgi:TldD protein